VNERIKAALSTSNSDVTFSGAATRTTSDPELRGRFEAADILLLPIEHELDYESPVFPTLTRDLYAFLINSKEQVHVEVATENDELQELVLYGDLIVLGLILIRDTAFTVALGLLTNFIYDMVKRKRGEPDSTTVRCELVIQENGQSRSLRYDGPASTFEKLLRTHVEPLDSHEKELKGGE
jgi:hypothetical protein